MTVYVPILKSKPAEYWACRTASHSVKSNSRFVFEVTPRYGADRDLTDFVNGVSPGWTPNTVLTIDTTYLDQMQPIAGSPDCAVMWAAKALDARGVPTRPVMRIDDGPQVLAEVAAAVALHGQGACLRLGSDEQDPDPDECAINVPDVLDAVNLGSQEVHLIIDLWSVQSPRDVARGVTTARSVVDWAAGFGPWASVTVAAGAFPPSISNFPTGVATAVPRLDAELFDRIVASGPPLSLDFGDYGIGSPGLPATTFRGPLPNLRFTNGRDWFVYRERRLLPGNESFFTVCAQVVQGPHWPGTGAAYSAGDREIERCAQATGGPGTATQWLQYGASHHAEHVVERLTNLGVP